MDLLCRIRPEGSGALEGQQCGTAKSGPRSTTLSDVTDQAAIPVIESVSTNSAGDDTLDQLLAERSGGPQGRVESRIGQEGIGYFS